MALTQYFRSEEESQHTHINYAKDERLALVGNRESIGRFWLTYGGMAEQNAALAKDGKGGIEELTYGERVTGACPVVAQFTLAFDRLSDNIAPYDDAFVQDLVATTQDVIMRTVECSEDETGRELLCLFSETPIEKGILGDSATIRLHFPLCRLSVADQKKQLRVALLKAYDKAGLFTRAYPRVRNKTEDAFSIDVPGEYMPMYGSQRLGDRSLLRYVATYGPGGDELPLDDVIDMRAYVRDERDAQAPVVDGGLDPGLHPAWRAIVAVAGSTLPTSRQMLPLFMSVHYNQGETNYIRTRKTVHDEGVEVGSPLDALDLDEVLFDGYSTQASQTAVRMLKLLSARSYSDPELAPIVGKALYGAFQGHPDGYRYWHRYSSDIGKEVEDLADYKERYSTYRTDNPYNEIQLMDMAKQDNPSHFKEWHEEHCHRLMVASLKCDSSGAIARAFYAHSWNKHVFMHGKWFRYDGTKLIEMDRDGPLYDVSEFRKEYDAMREHFAGLSKQMSNTSTRDRAATRRGRGAAALDDDDADRNSQRNMTTAINACGKIAKMLDETRSIRGIILHYKWILLEKHANAIPNHIRRSFAFEGGVFVSYCNENTDPITGRGFKIRNGFVQDYTINYTTIPYREDFDWNSPMVKEYLEEVEAKVFPYKEPRIFVRHKLSKALVSANGDGKANIFLGATRSGKTQFKGVVDVCFGYRVGDMNGYCYTYPPTTLTAKRGSSSAASPEVMYTVWRKIVHTEEPEDSDFTNEAFMRTDTGQCVRFTRGLFKDGGNYEATHMSLYWSNQMTPMLPLQENKVRVIIIPCPSRFLPIHGDEANGIYMPESEKERKRLHYFIEDKMNSQRQVPRATGALWVFINSHDHVDFRNGESLPKMIKAATDNYWNHTDIFTRFINAHVRDTYDEKVFLKSHVLYEVFRRWVRNRFPSRKLPNEDKMAQCFTSLLGEAKQRAIKHPNAIKRTGKTMGSEGQLPAARGVGKYEGEVMEGYGRLALYSDTYAEYVSERLESTDNEEDVLTVQRIFGDYKGWIREDRNEAKSPDYGEFTAHMAYFLGPVDRSIGRGGSYVGVRFAQGDRPDMRPELGARTDLDEYLQ